jgi:hypothetical protein
MFTQKISRQPTVLTRAPPAIGPSAMLIPTTAPQMPKAGSQAAERGAEREHRQAGLERPAASHAVRRRSGQHQEAGEDQGVGVNDPLQAGDRGVQLPAETEVMTGGPGGQDKNG